MLHADAPLVSHKAEAWLSSVLPLYYSLGEVISSPGVSHHCYVNDAQLMLSFPPSDTHVPSQISACLADIIADSSSSAET